MSPRHRQHCAQRPSEPRLGAAGSHRSSCVSQGKSCCRRDEEAVRSQEPLAPPVGTSVYAVDGVRTRVIAQFCHALQRTVKASAHSQFTFIPEGPRGFLSESSSGYPSFFTWLAPSHPTSFRSSTHQRQRGTLVRT